MSGDEYVAFAFIGFGEGMGGVRIMRQTTRNRLMALLVAGAVAALGGCGSDSPARPAASATALATEPAPSAAPSMTPTPTPTATATATATATVVRRRVTVTRRIPYKTRRVKDPSLARGHTRVRISGKAGRRTLTYVVRYTNGKRTSRRLVRKTVTRRPTTKVIAVGTKEHRSCDPNYSGACVPIASDVDCAGGDGNGPAYVEGPVRVVGHDVYDLDRDGDGIACD